MLLRKGSKGKDVKKLQNGLKALGYSLGTDGDFGRSTKKIVEKFQRDHDLYDDGIVGNGTAGVYDQALKTLSNTNALEFLLLEQMKTPFCPENPFQMEWKTCPADIFPGRDGYDHLLLRTDVANAYIDLYNAVHELGGILTTAGGKRKLTTGSNISRSKTSFHYTGRAFDMALPTGMQNPDIDPFIIVSCEDRIWSVWCRTDKTMTEMAHLIESQKLPTRVTDCLTATYMIGGKVLEKEVTGVFFSFTDLARAFGFESIRARSRFYKGVYTSAEWWHFQYETGLATGISTFGRGLLKIYTLEEVEEFVYWNLVKDYRFRIEWD